ncbi:hypothetical protein AYI69_g4005 [Smittium culicis]|uniref:Uncharacterized protein n=1 Tax=Smittium culicis TaxID=133412 RepID=A0A1R1YHI1_9FUNG|nr:hypothetical protein AYI69_g4005 [Smittium culicis]
MLMKFNTSQASSSTQNQIITSLIHKNISQDIDKLKVKDQNHVAASISLTDEHDSISDLESLLLSPISILELGFLEIQDDLLILSAEKFFSKSVFSFSLSKDLFMTRLKNKTIPDYMKYALLSYGVKLLDGHVFFKDDLYLLGSSYAQKSLNLINASLNDISVDKIFSIALISLHFIGLSKINLFEYLISKKMFF